MANRNSNKQALRKKEKPAWERQSYESMAEFKLFQAYLLMNGMDKGLRRVSLRVYAEEIGYSQSYMYNLSYHKNWQARLDAYDEHILEMMRSEHEQESIRMLQNHVKYAEQLQRKGMKRVLTIPEEEMSAGDALNFLKEGVKMERQARGEPGEIISNKHDGEVSINDKKSIDLSRLTEEELMGLDQAIGKINTNGGDDEG